MPELRKDPIVGRWVIIATERARRPGNVVEPADELLDDDPQECPFCRIDEPPYYSAVLSGRRHNGAAWDVCVMPFRRSFLTTQKALERKNQGLYDLINGFGVHDVVIETHDHTANMADLEIAQIKLVLETYTRRVSELAEDTRVRYVLVYKNYGTTAGGRTISHARSHIVATPIIPAHLKEKLAGAREYFHSFRRCVFCDILQQELKDKERIVAETEHFLAFVTFAPRFLFEMRIFPKKHHCDFSRGVSGYESDLARMMKVVLQKMKNGLDDRSYNYVIQTAPFARPDDHQRWLTIKDDFHWHIEILPHLTRAAGFEKGTGFYICAIPPEEMAAYLREVKV